MSGGNGPVLALSGAAFTVESDAEVVKGDEGQQAAQPRRCAQVLNGRVPGGCGLVPVDEIVWNVECHLGELIGELGDSGVAGHGAAPLRRGLRQFLDCSGPGGRAASGQRVHRAIIARSAS
ncbi:hypothetical protein OG923_34060 (plasmid) [Streptomyces halstedii]|uniref:hypothetical protein n=1 Tax=Streptomyces halstedii TaxID=1944 RepID=UPI00325487C4